MVDSDTSIKCECLPHRNGEASTQGPGGILDSSERNVRLVRTEIATHLAITARELARVFGVSV
jgi:hypothetical protein